MIVLINYRMAFYSYFKQLYDAMCDHMSEDALLNILMTLHNSNYFTAVGYISNKMNQQQLLDKTKQFAASVKEPDYTEALKISKLLQLETWPACKNATKCQLLTVRFKPDIALVVEEVQVDRGDGDGDDDGGDDGSDGGDHAHGDGGSDGGGGNGRDDGDSNDDDDDPDGGRKGMKCTKKSQSTKSKKEKVDVVAQVHRQQGEEEEEEQKGEEVLEQEEEGDQSIRP